MSKKIDRALYGPSWTEVFFGALLSIILGVVLAGVYLATKPVQVVKELPKELGADVVYYIEGSRDSNKGRQWKAKHQLLVAGKSVVVSEDELNTAVGALAAPAVKPSTPAKPPVDPKKPEEAVGLMPTLVAGALNFRIRDNAMQISVPVSVTALSLGATVLVQSTGGFVQDGDHFAYKPDTLLVGSLPVQRIPFLSSYVMSKFFTAESVPADIAGAWQRLANVTVEGAQLKLQAP